MKNIVFSGIISRVFLDEFVSCLSLIDGNFYFPILKDKKENYSLTKNMFESLNINIKLKKEQNYKDNNSDGFVIEIFYKTNHIEDSFLILLKKTFKKIGGCSYSICSNENKIEENIFDSYNCISNYKNSYEEYIGRYYIDELKNKTSLYKIHEKLYNLGLFNPKNNEKFDKIMDKIIDNQIKNYIQSCKKDWSEEIIKTFSRAKKETYFGYKPNLYFFRYFTNFKHNWISVDDFKNIKSKDVEDYIEFLKECISLKDIQKYTKGIDLFLNEINCQLLFSSFFDKKFQTSMF